MKKKTKLIILIVCGCLALLLGVISVKSLIANNANYELDNDYQSTTTGAVDTEISNDSISETNADVSESEVEVAEGDKTSNDTTETNVSSNTQATESQDDSGLEEESQGAIDMTDGEVASDGIDDEETESNDEISNENPDRNDEVIEEETADSKTVEGEMTVSETANEDTSSSGGTEEQPTGDAEDAGNAEDTEEEIVAYKGDEYIDSAIDEHRDEIEDADIDKGLGIGNKIDSSIVYGYLEDGLTDEERTELNEYLHSVLTDDEYATVVELFNKYSYILE